MVGYYYFHTCSFHKQQFKQDDYSHLTIFPMLAWNSWVQGIFLPQPPQLLELRMNF